MNRPYIRLYASGKLLRETWGDNTLDFFYDESGHPYALKYNGTTYYYVTNLQGDVLAILDSSKQVVASYSYDPYGKVLSATGTLAEINPLRYRGYYYDQETGFYYLQSRYYDPTICRFINADSYASTGQGILGHNMFAYCRNNPIRRVDIAGTADADCYDNDPLDEEDRLEIGRGGGGGPSTGTSPSTSYTSGSSRRASSTAYTNGSSKRAISASPKSKPSKIPPKAQMVLEHLKNNNMHPPKNYKGGKIYANDGRNGGQKLPNEGAPYREYDVDPKTPGVDRGKERIVVGADGSAWYTPDHYKTFFKME